MLGELKKIVRNRVFWLITLFLLGANLFMVMYYSRQYGTMLQEQKAKSQKEYVRSYDMFIDEMKERAKILQEMQQDTMTRYAHKNIQKTLRDYKKIGKITISPKYNYGVEQYAKYGYGLYFLIVFSYIGLEVVFLSEKRNGLIGLLRTSKKGRQYLMRCKLWVYTLCVAIFVLAQEAVTLAGFHMIYGLGDLSCSIQSIPKFRDCIFRITMGEGIAWMLGIKVFLAIVISMMVFFFGVICSRVIFRVGIPLAVLGSQFLIYQKTIIDSSMDYLHCVNVFFGWDMRNVLGSYHNLNIFGEPVEKSAVLFITGGLVILLVVLLLPVLFDRFYRIGSTRGSRIWNWISYHIGDLFLHRRSIFINEGYKLLFMQKKVLVLVVFLFYLFSARDAYLPTDMYPNAKVASYYLFLSKLQGPDDAKAKSYVHKQKEELDELCRKMDEADAKNDTILRMTYQSQYEDKIDGYNMISDQEQRIQQSGGGYWLNEMSLKRMLRQYDRDIVMVGMTILSVVVLLSGIFASMKEKNIEALTRSTRNGQSVIFRKKMILSVLLITICGIVMNLPLLKGLQKILYKGNWNLSLQCLSDPYIPSSMTVGGFFILIILIRSALLVLSSTATMWFGRKCKNEFYTTVLMTGIVLIACVVLYIFRMNLALFLIKAMGGVCDAN